MLFILTHFCALQQVFTTKIISEASVANFCLYIGLTFHFHLQNCCDSAGVEIIREITPVRRVPTPQLIFIELLFALVSLFFQRRHVNNKTVFHIAFQ